MSKLQGAANNFANHITSGLSDFVMLAYEASETTRTSRLEFRLIPTPAMPEMLNNESELARCLERLATKLVAILESDSRLPLAEIQSSAIWIDFELESARVKEKQHRLANHRVSYAHDPIFKGHFQIRLNSGQQVSVPIHSHDEHGNDRVHG